ncbi:MAG: hypothetical protein ACKO5K_11525 [Armatimonadota bacterium]
MPDKRRAILEYVSADPGAPITADRVRQGIAGDVLARAWSHIGAEVCREYYVNDLSGGASAETTDEPWNSLRAVGIEFDRIVRESTVVGSGAVDAVVSDLLAGGNAEVRDGAVWLRSASQGDSQDRVLKRADGRPTYLAVDLAYHRDKFLRGFDLAVDLWDTRHEDYVARTWVGLGAVGVDPERLRIAIVHPVRILDGGIERRNGPGDAPWNVATLVARLTVSALRLRLALFPLGETAWLDLDQGRTDPLTERIARAGRLPVATNDSDPALVLVRAKANGLDDIVAQAVAHQAPNRIAEYCIDLASAIVAAGRSTATAKAALTQAVGLLGVEELLVA